MTMKYDDKTLYDFILEQYDLSRDRSTADVFNDIGINEYVA